MPHLLRRSVLSGLAVAGLAHRARAESDKLRIGLLCALSGTSQRFGAAMRLGSEIAVARVNAAGGVLGRQLELVARDDQANPNATLAGFRELAGDGVKLFTTGVYTAQATSLLPGLEPADAVCIASGTVAMSITHELFNRRMFRNGFNSTMYYGGQTRIVAEHFPDVLKWVVLVMDNAAGQDIVDGFQAGIKAAHAKTGGVAQVLKVMRVTPGSANLRNQITEIADSGADGLFAFLIGNDAITFYSQAHPLRLDERIRLVHDAGSGLDIANALGRNMPRNMLCGVAWYWGADPGNAVSQDLYQAQLRQGGSTDPLAYMGVAHDTILSFAAGLQAAGSAGSDALIKALEGVTVQGATGKLRYRPEDHQLIEDITCLNFGADDAAPNGWKLFNTYHVDGAEVVEPASPGKKFEF